MDVLSEQRSCFRTVSLGVVCPMANERDSAESFVKLVLEHCIGFKSVKFFAILDKASKDGTRDILVNLAKYQPQLCVVWSPKNRCVVDAYIRGYQEALASGCDWILEIDAGFSHQPSDIPNFFNKMLEGYDCVFGSRFCRGGKIAESSFKRYVLSRGGSWLTNLLLGTKLKDMTSGFELFSCQSLRYVLQKGIYSKGHFFQTEIKVHCQNLRVAEVPISYRRATKANINNSLIIDALKNLWRLIIERVQRNCRVLKIGRKSVKPK